MHNPVHPFSIAFANRLDQANETSFQAFIELQQVYCDILAHDHALQDILDCAVKSESFYKKVMQLLAIEQDAVVKSQKQKKLAVVQPGFTLSLV